MSPEGAVSNVRLTFVGQMIADRLAFNPSASVTVNVIRNLVLPLKSCPLVGIVNVPLVPVLGEPGWTWLSCRKSTVQTYELGDRTPSGSVAAPLNVTTSPATMNPPSDGVVLNELITGGLPTLMFTGAESAVLTPSDTVSRARYTRGVV